MPRTHYRNGDEIRAQWHACDGCNPYVINGVFVHESGCPDAWRDHEIECFECGCEFLPAERGQRACPGCDTSDCPEECDYCGNMVAFCICPENTTYEDED
jgi:hypothetical protein